MEETKVYNVREFSELLKISESKARLMVRDGQVKVVRLGDRILIPSKSISEILERACYEDKAGICQ